MLRDILLKICNDMSMATQAWHIGKGQRNLMDILRKAGADPEILIRGRESRRRRHRGG